MKKLKVLVLVPESGVPPESLKGVTDKELIEFPNEYDVVNTLREIGHETEVLGVQSDLGAIRRKINSFKPHITFNLLESFHGVSVYDQHVASYLELMKQAYTGCNPRGLLIGHDKALSKKILTYHRIKTPRFAVFRMRKKIVPPKNLKYPMIVKSLIEHGSYGLAQSSLVTNEKALVERVQYLHEQLDTHAMAEEYIDGRELYVAVLGNRRLETLPIQELFFGDLREEAPRIATYRVKWDWAYQEKLGIDLRTVKDLPPNVVNEVNKLGKRVYRALSLSGYGRIDLRLTPEGELYVLEANPNADVAEDEELSNAFSAAGGDYAGLLQKIIQVGLSYEAEWRLVET